MGKGKHTFQRLVNFNLAPFWETMSRNWILKILCLLLAFAVWQGIRESTSQEAVVADIPVKIIAGKGRAVLDQSSDVVSIRFRGSREDVRYISRDQVDVALDLSGRTDRLRQTVKLAPRYVHALSRAHAVDFEPAEITVTMDREVERSLPVKAMLEGALPAGIQREKAVCAPASVKVRGAERLLRDLEQVRTVPIRLDGRYNSFKTRVAVAAADQPWTASPERVAVDVTLVERVATRRIENTSVRPLLDSADSRTVFIQPSKVTVSLSGSPERMEALNDREIYAYVDCTEMTEPTEYEVPVRVDVPDGVVVENVEPAAVQVAVKKM